MASVGAHLRDLRERRGLSLEEIGRATRVAPRYLEALEADAFGSLPAPVFTRGFIRAYCQALGESPDDAIALFDRGGAPVAPPAPRQPAPRVAEREPRTRGAVLVSFVLLVVLGMALFAVALMIQPRGGDRPEPLPTLADSTPPREPSAPSPTASTPPPPPPSPAPPSASSATAERPAPVGAIRPPVAQPPAPSAVTTLPPTPARTPTAPSTAQAPPAAGPPPSATAAQSPAASAPAAAPAAPPGSPPPPSPASAELHAALGSLNAPFHLVARTSEPTWIRVRTADGRVSEENVPAGQVREWVSDRPFVLTIGNAGGVSFVLNGRPVPSLGGSGAVVSRLVLPPDNR